MANLTSIKNSIISYMRSGNIFINANIDPVIIKEVPFFLNILSRVFNLEEDFHGYVNKIYDTWDVILSPEFKSVITKYNSYYINYQNIKEQKQMELINMANQLVADSLFDELDSLTITPNIDSISRGIKKTKVARKKPSRKLKK